MKYLPILAFTVLLLVGCRKDTAHPSNDAQYSPTAETLTNAIETPEEAIQQFFAGIADGDRSKAFSAAVSNEAVEDYIDANINLVQASDAFARVENERFGVEGGVPVGALSNSLLARIENLKLELIDDNTANWAKNPSRPLVVRKTKQGWKIDFTTPQFSEFLQMATSAFSDSARLFDEIRGSISNGDIESRAEMRKEMARLKHEFGL